MYGFRTKETHEAYAAARAAGHLGDECPLCTAPSITEFTHWRTINNRFPYDRVAQVHHMLIPRTHCTEHELSPEAVAELLDIKHTQLVAYEFILEALPHMKSIPAHFHLHLLRSHEII